MPRPWTRLFPLVDFMRVRTLAIDETVAAAAEEGTGQLVVLGAGLCARAWRMPELQDSIVYEVDHLDTQRYKRTRLEGLEPKARAVRFVPVNFEKDDLVTSLQKAGHDAKAPTTWIWEGVTPYLTPTAIGTTIASVRSRSAPGSTFIITYGTPVAGRRSNGPKRVLYRLAYPLFRAIGEPISGLLSVEAMHEMLERQGFAIDDDATYGELAKRLRVRAPTPFVSERIAVAVIPRRASEAN